MTDLLADLQRIDYGIRQLEEHHNDVLDVSEATNKSITILAQEIELEGARIREDIAQLKENIRERINKAKRATVIMSLLAQQEELAPVKNRIDQQPYEEYVTSEWFARKLAELR